MVSVNYNIKTVRTQFFFSNSVIGSWNADKRFSESQSSTELLVFLRKCKKGGRITPALRFGMQLKLDGSQTI